MDNDYALAFALANDSLCILAGAGVAKHLSGGATPDWRQLLDDVCDAHPEPTAAREIMNHEAVRRLPLEEQAQVLELEFTKAQLSFRHEVASLIRAAELDPWASATFRKFLADHPNLSILTTNYDDLLEELLEDGNCESNYPGRPISRTRDAVRIWHVHGHVSQPEHMVATASDYFRFMALENYYYDKISTALHENTVLILGYSLSDMHLKVILNRFRANDTRTINRGSTFLVTEGDTPSPIRDYYEDAFGISVMSKLGVDEVIAAINARYDEAVSWTDETGEALERVLSGGTTWKREHVKIRGALFHMIGTASVLGIDVGSEKFLEMLSRVLKTKVDLTHEDQAWDQYSHLADWLVYLGSIMDVEGTPIENAYREAVLHSLKTMSRAYRPGYSWAAFRTWDRKWFNLTMSNRHLVRRWGEGEGLSAETSAVVNR